jgi:hypothetical protein
MAKAYLRGGGKAQSMVGVSAFLDEDFLLTTATARRLYHDYAESQTMLNYYHRFRT